MAAHLTIREVANDEQLEKIKLQLLQPELVWIANTHELKINTKDGLYTIGASKGSTPDTEETMANIKEALQDMGIIYNDASKSISLAKVEDVTFVRSDNQQYKVAVDSDGNLCTELQSTGQLKTLVDKAKTKIKEFPKAADGVTELFTNKSVKAFSAKILYTIKALTCPLPDDGREDNEGNHIEYWKSTHTAKISADWGLYADRIKIGSIYVKGNIANNACGCSHAYIELENTSDEDFPIDGCKMFFINGDTVISKEVYGVIPAGSTFLIRGKKYRDYEECIINVKTYDKKSGKLGIVCWNGQNEDAKFTGTRVQEGVYVEWPNDKEYPIIKGAAYNDYAEYRRSIESIPAGYCVASSDKGEVYKTSKKFRQNQKVAV